MRASEKDLKRWLRKARRVFGRDRNGQYIDGPEQWDRATDLARDVWRTLDRKTWERVTER